MKHGVIFTDGRLWRSPWKQRGAITMFSAVLILILLTSVIIYAVQVGVFEQRKSSNEMRQKEAFHLADSAIQYSKEFMLSNALLIASAENDILFDGSDGWLPGSIDPHWRPCTDADLSAATGQHPCYAEPADAEAAADNSNNINVNLRDNMYFYMLDPTEDPDDIANAELPIDVSGLLADNTQDLAVYALLCMLDVNPLNAQLSPPQPVVEGCTTVPSEQDERFYMVTLLARGEADCQGGTCTAKALIADKIGSLGPGGHGGGPGAPLTTKSNFPPQGNTDIVANPNGGGVGVPMSVWIDDDAFVDGGGDSWATCERHEWYEQDTLPDQDFVPSHLKYKCPAGGGNCTCTGKKQLSYPVPGGDPFLNIDIVPDPAFPPDLFEYTFGVAGDKKGIDTVKATAVQVLEDCDSSQLNERSYGLIWVEGDCDLPDGNGYLSPPPVKQIGTARAPVFLVLAGANNRFTGQFDLFGGIMLTDVENPGAEISGAGTPTIYGAMIIDGAIDKFTGTLGLVYLENILDRTIPVGNFGTAAGAWSDFHQDWR